MKTINTFLLLLALTPIIGYSQTDAIDDFYYNHGLSENILKLKIGNSLIKMGSWFIEEPAARNLVKKSNRARIMLSDDTEAIRKSDVDRLVRDIRRDGYESLAMLRDGLQKFEVYVREDRDIIRNLLVVIHGDDQFLMASLDCRLTMEEIEAALNEEL